MTDFTVMIGISFKRDYGELLDSWIDRNILLIEGILMIFENLEVMVYDACEAYRLICRLLESVWFDYFDSRHLWNENFQDLYRWSIHVLENEELHFRCFHFLQTADIYGIFNS